MSSFAGGWNTGCLLFIYGPYDEVVKSDDPKAYWPLDSKDPTVYADYDDLILNFSTGGAPKAYWPLNAKTSVTYNYDSTVLADGPKAYWPLNDIDTV